MMTRVCGANIIISIMSNVINLQGLQCVKVINIDVHIIAEKRSQNNATGYKIVKQLVSFGLFVIIYTENIESRMYKNVEQFSMSYLSKIETSFK